MLQLIILKSMYNLIDQSMSSVELNQILTQWSTMVTINEVTRWDLNYSTACLKMCCGTMATQHIKRVFNVVI